MYTRFKSQKSRIKVGLKALSTNPSRTCIVASSTTPASSFKPMDEKQLQQSATCKQNCFTSQLLANERIPKPPKNSSRASKSKKLASFNSSDNDDYDLNVDAISISYVKSMWEKYENQIGKNVVVHVDESSEYPHLQDFVAFDMEHWWAERSISSMTNDKSFQFFSRTASNGSTSSANSGTDVNNDFNNNFDTFNICI